MGMEMRVTRAVAEWAERSGLRGAGNLKKLQEAALEAAERAAKKGGDALHEALEAAKRTADKLKLKPSKKGSIPPTLTAPEQVARQPLAADLRSLKIDGVTPDTREVWLMGHADIPPEQTGMVFTGREEYSVVYDKVAKQVRLNTGNETRAMTPEEQGALRERLLELLQNPNYALARHPVWQQEKGVIEEIAGALGLGNKLRKK